MNLSVFLEMSNGRTMRVESIKKYIDYISDFGYKIIYLGLTDAYKIEGEPYFNYNRAGYTSSQLKEIDNYAKQRNVELRVSIQTLAHLSFVLQYKCYENIMDTSDILLVGEEKTYEFIEKMIKTMSESVSSRILHLGMDEAFNLGKGKYKVLHGERSKEDIFTEHLARVASIAEKYGYKCEIWSDMFFRMVENCDYENGGSAVPENIKKKIPENVSLCYWNYTGLDKDILSKQIEMNKSVCDRVTFAGTIWTIFGLAPYNKISSEHIGIQMDVCKKCGLTDYMVTLWTDNTLCDFWSTLPALFYVSEYNKTNLPPSEKAKKHFNELVGIAYDDFMTLDYLNDPFMKNINTYSTISLMGFFSDILYGYYDHFIDNNVEEQYLKLSEMYRSQLNKGFDFIFKPFALYAEILSLKASISKRIRLNYKNKDLEQLSIVVDKPLQSLITKIDEFTKLFFNCWNENYYPQGSETNISYLGGLKARIENIALRLNEYITSGKIIEELERKELPPSDGFSIENAWYTKIKKIMSFTNFY